MPARFFVINPNHSGCCDLPVTFCGLILHLTGCKTIHILEIFSGVHSLVGETVVTYSV